jgi:pimeloyl-ACP methyl ester carboxylesterase
MTPMLVAALLYAVAPSLKPIEANAELGAFTFRDGKKLDAVGIHYATLGTLRRDAAGRAQNAVLLLHWTSASGAALRTPDFVEALYGSGKPLDASCYYLIFIDAVGHGQSSKPSDGLHARFPSYGYEDIVTLQRARTFALNFSDDEFDPVVLGMLENSMRRVPRGTYVVQPGTTTSFGHLTQAHPELWARQLGQFMAQLTKVRP